MSVSGSDAGSGFPVLQELTIRMTDAISPGRIDQYADTHAIAELTGLSSGYLKQLRVKGGGPAFSRIGAAVRYRIGDVQAWMASKSVTSTSQREAA